MKYLLIFITFLFLPYCYGQHQEITCETDSTMIIVAPTKTNIDNEVPKHLELFKTQLLIVGIACLLFALMGILIKINANYKVIVLVGVSSMIFAIIMIISVIISIIIDIFS